MCESGVQYIADCGGVCKRHRGHVSALQRAKQPPCRIPNAHRLVQRSGRHFCPSGENATTHNSVPAACESGPLTPHPNATFLSRSGHDSSVGRERHRGHPCVSVWNQAPRRIPNAHRMSSDPTPFLPSGENATETHKSAPQRASKPDSASQMAPLSLIRTRFWCRRERMPPRTHHKFPCSVRIRAPDSEFQMRTSSIRTRFGRWERTPPTTQSSVPFQWNRPRLCIPNAHVLSRSDTILCRRERTPPSHNSVCPCSGELPPCPHP